jgi:transposase
VILDSHGTHNHPKDIQWLGRQPRFGFRFPPTLCSWINAVEGFFAKLTKRRLKREIFTSIIDFQAAINRFLTQHNEKPKLFVDGRFSPRPRCYRTREARVRVDPLANLRIKNLSMILVTVYDRGRSFWARQNMPIAPVNLNDLTSYLSVAGRMA